MIMLTPSRQVTMSEDQSWLILASWAEGRHGVDITQ